MTVKINKGIIIFWVLLPFIFLTFQNFSASGQENPGKTLQDHDPGKNPNPSPTSAPEGQKSGTVIYTAEEGDTVWKIAGKTLGDPSRWTEIVQLNINRYPSLKTNPDLVYPGWQLIVPDNPIIAAKAGSQSTDTGVSASVGQAGGPPPDPTAPTEVGGITTRTPEFKAWLAEAVQAAQGWSFPEMNNKFGQPITREDYIKAIIEIESNGVHKKANGSITTSSCGAKGFMQLMPATAKGVGLDPNDGRENVIAGAKYLKECFNGPATRGTGGAEKLIKAACGYNRGPYSHELASENWDDYVSNCKVTENVGYGVKLKMCLGMDLTSAEKSWWGSHMSGSADSAANSFYSKTKGLVA
ncbi:MAG: transglycosylase SLT domain-containing protein [Candidatus Riflebacteria bacterium]|nr:transglycosylase SLT domain-containing protein [Candidatus Riflebacteria bacterium]